MLSCLTINSLDSMSQFIEMFGNCSERKSLCSICRPKQWPTIPTKDFPEDGYLVYGANGVIGHYTEYNHENPTILMACRGASCGAINISRPKSYITGNAMCLDELSEEVKFEYLAYFLSQFDYKIIITGGAQPQITYTNLKKVDVPIPAIELQCEFVKIFQQADKSGFDGLKSQFIEMFGNPVTNNKGWNTLPIKDVAPEDPSSEKQTGNVWILNLDMIESNTGKVVGKVFEDDSNLLSVAPFDEGNVLYSKLRPYLNKVIIPDGKGYATTELIPLRPNQELLNLTFFSHLLRGDDFVTYANSISTGTKMPRMPLNDLRKFPCILPPMDKQNEFEVIARQADKSGSVLQCRIAC